MVGICLIEKMWSLQLWVHSRHARLKELHKLYWNFCNTNMLFSFVCLLNADHAWFKRNTGSCILLLCSNEPNISKLSTIPYIVILHSTTQCHHFLDIYFAKVLQMNTLRPTDRISNTQWGCVRSGCKKERLTSTWPFQLLIISSNNTAIVSIK